MIRAEDVQCHWPKCLSFTAVCEEKRIRVETQLCGTHLVPNVLAAIAVGQLLGVSLETAAAGIRKALPSDGRMSPVTTPDGITFIRDDCKAPLWTIPASLEFVRDAAARRKIIVIGTISDFPGDSSSRYRQVARQAMDIADAVIFVGPQASQCLGAKRKGDNLLRAYPSTDQLFQFFRGYLQPGDLVLLKGSEKVENLAQVVSLWVERKPAETAASNSSVEVPARAGRKPKKYEFSREGCNGPLHVIVGLGNPGSQYENTPHNVGQQTLDLLAEMLEVQWSTQHDAVFGRATVQGHDVLLVKPQTLVNDTGPLLVQLSEQLGFSHEQCILIHDDVDLDIGTLRLRRTGSDGGHRGVQSILVAFQSQQFTRVKIGVGRPASRKDLAKYVLTPFKKEQRMAISQSCRDAADRVLETISSATKYASHVPK
jgi:aminoacyl-tRNA hydrolase